MASYVTLEPYYTKYAERIGKFGKKENRTVSDGTAMPWCTHTGSIPKVEYKLV